MRWKNLALKRKSWLRRKVSSAYSIYSSNKYCELSMWWTLLNLIFFSGFKVYTSASAICGEQTWSDPIQTVDISSVLYGAFYHSEASRIVGVELNAQFCDIANRIVKKHLLNKRQATHITSNKQCVHKLFYFLDRF